MNPPHIETCAQAINFAAVVRKVTRCSPAWSEIFAGEAWINETINSVIANDWEYVWSDQACREIMALYVAFQIER